MNKITTLIKAWVATHSTHPEAIEDKDWNLLSNALDFASAQAQILIAFAIYSAVYLWGYGKYGFDKTIIEVGIAIIVTLGYQGAQIRKALGS
jgi:hypothetical protein